MINLDNIINDNNNNHNEKWPHIPHHPYRILIIGGSGSGKTNTLLNLINEQRDIDKIYLHAKDLSEPKYEHLIFNEGLSEGDKKEGLLKKLKNIEDKNEQLLKIKNKTENIKEVTDFVGEPLSPEAKAVIEEIRAAQKDVDYRKLITGGANNVTSDFSDYKTFNELYRDLYYKNMTIK